MSSVLSPGMTKYQKIANGRLEGQWLISTIACEFALSQTDSHTRSATKVSVRRPNMNSVTGRQYLLKLNIMEEFIIRPFFLLLTILAANGRFFTARISVACRSIVTKLCIYVNLATFHHPHVTLTSEPRYSRSKVKLSTRFSRQRLAGGGCRLVGSKFTSRSTFVSTLTVKVKWVSAHWLFNWI